jgi:hypothetical protein
MQKQVVQCKFCLNKETVFTSRAKDYKYCSRSCMSKDFTCIKFSKNDKINNWLIISDEPIRKFGRTYVKVQCTCGSNIIKDLPIEHYTSKKSKGCEKCSRSASSKGVGLISGEYWSLIKHGAQKRNINFNISIEDAWNLYTLQKGKCKLSNLDIFFEPNSVHKKNMNNRSKRTASLDRIDSAKEYSIENVQWVHKDINIMKNKFDVIYFKKICNLITKNNENKI